MRTNARRGTLIASAAAALSVMLSPATAGADLIGVAGTYSVEIPMTPGGLSFTLTLNGETYEFSNVDDSLGGTLTLGWAGSQQAPRTSLAGCPHQAPGSQILLEEATPSASVWATWTSPTGQRVLGPAEVSSRDGFVVAGACLAEDPGEGGGGNGGPGGGEGPILPCAGNNGNGNGNGGHGNGNGNGNGGHNNGNGNGNGGHGNGNGKGKGNAFGHQCR